MPENIYALEPTLNLHKALLSTVFPPGQGEFAQGERADYLPNFTRAAGGTVTLDRHELWEIQNYAYEHVHRSAGHWEPTTFIQRKLWQHKLGCGAAG